MPLTREEVFALIDETIFTNNSAQVQAADLNTLLKAIYDNAPNTGFEHYIGETFGGGVIFHLWKDSEGVEHGLVVSKNQGTSTFSNITGAPIGTTARSSVDGLNNSLAIIAQDGHSSSGAKLCLDSTEEDFIDWYLPSMYELQLIFNNRYEVDKKMIELGATQLSYGFNYLSSTENSSTTSNVFTSALNQFSSSNKSTTLSFRAIRQF
jgi:hypothetical protein